MPDRGLDRAAVVGVALAGSVTGVSVGAQPGPWTIMLGMMLLVVLIAHGRPSAQTERNWWECAAFGLVFGLCSTIALSPLIVLLSQADGAIAERTTVQDWYSFPDLVIVGIWAVIAAIVTVLMKNEEL